MSHNQTIAPHCPETEFWQVAKCAQSFCDTLGVHPTTWEQTVPNTVQNRDARHRKMLDEPTISLLRLPVTQEVTPAGFDRTVHHCKALKETKGDKIAAARILGIGKTTIYRKLRQYSQNPI
jgi:DNA-binding NtrC family response regulator